MKLIETSKFDYEKRNGEEIWCLECLSNDKEERSIEIYECKNEKEAKEMEEYYNKNNQDKNFKYVSIKYKVSDECLEVC